MFYNDCYMSKVTFDEDKTILRKSRPRQAAPEGGFEGWIHKHSPYAVKTTRLVLIILAIIIFIISAMFLFATIYNSGQIESRNLENFNSRVESTRSR